MFGTWVRNAACEMKCITSMPAFSIVPLEAVNPFRGPTKVQISHSPGIFLAMRLHADGCGATTSSSRRHEPFRYARNHSCESRYTRKKYSSSPFAISENVL